MNNFVADLQKKLFYNINTIARLEILPAIHTYSGKEYQIFKVVGYIAESPVIFGVFENQADAFNETQKIFRTAQLDSDDYINL